MTTQTITLTTVEQLIEILRGSTTNVTFLTSDNQECNVQKEVLEAVLNEGSPILKIMEDLETTSTSNNNNNEKRSKNENIINIPFTGKVVNYWLNFIYFTQNNIQNNNQKIMDYGSNDYADLLELNEYLDTKLEVSKRIFIDPKYFILLDKPMTYELYSRFVTSYLIFCHRLNIILPELVNKYNNVIQLIDNMKIIMTRIGQVNIVKLWMEKMLPNFTVNDLDISYINSQGEQKEWKYIIEMIYCLSNLQGNDLIEDAILYLLNSTNYKDNNQTTFSFTRIKHLIGQDSSLKRKISNWIASNKITEPAKEMKEVDLFKIIYPFYSSPRPITSAFGSITPRDYYQQPNQGMISHYIAFLKEGYELKSEENKSFS